MACAKADRILKEIRTKQFRQQGGSPIDDIDTENHKLRMAIAERAHEGEETSIDDVLVLDEVIGRDRRKKASERLIQLQRCDAKSENLKLFRVENRAGRNINVAAIDVECAKMFASGCGHVREAKNAKVFVYSQKWLERQESEGSAIWRVLREGIPGVLKEVGNHIIIERRAKVFSPISAVASPHPRFAKK